MTNNEIVEQNFRLIKECLNYQFLKQDRTFMKDFEQDLMLILLTYDNEKLNRIVEENHFNAFVTGIIRNSILSKNSPYYKTYRKFDDKSQEITDIRIPE